MDTSRNPFEDAARRAAERTNEELEAELSGLTRLTGAELQRLFPDRSDKERLIELLEIVSAATAENEKILRLKRNMDRLGGVAVRLLQALV